MNFPAGHVQITSLDVGKQFSTHAPHASTPARIGACSTCARIGFFACLHRHTCSKSTCRQTDVYEPICMAICMPGLPTRLCLWSFCATSCESEQGLDRSRQSKEADWAKLKGCCRRDGPATLAPHLATLRKSSLPPCLTDYTYDSQNTITLYYASKPWIICDFWA